MAFLFQHFGLKSSRPIQLEAVMNLKRQLTFRRELWLSMSIALFIIGGFVDFVPEWGKGQGVLHSVWKMWFVLINTDKDEVPYLQGMNNGLMFVTVFLAVCAATVALALHYLLGIVWEDFFKRRFQTEALPSSSQPGRNG